MVSWRRTGFAAAAALGLSAGAASAHCYGADDADRNEKPDNGKWTFLQTNPPGQAYTIKRNCAEKDRNDLGAQSYLIGDERCGPGLETRERVGKIEYNSGREVIYPYALCFEQAAAADVADPAMVDVYFSLDKFALRRESAQELAAFLSSKAPQGGAVVVRGHTDRKFTDAHNDALSQNRVDTIVAQIRAVRPDLVIVKEAACSEIRAERAGRPDDVPNGPDRVVEVAAGTFDQISRLAFLNSGRQESCTAALGPQDQNYGFDDPLPAFK